MQVNYIWMNGEIRPWDEAKVHVMTHALHYGSSVFDGLRAYEVKDHSAILCAHKHFERLLFSCRVMRLESPLSVEQWIAATRDTLEANRHRSAYIRPLVFRAGGIFGLDGRRDPTQAILSTLPLGTLLGEAALEDGIDVQVSSWRRSTESLNLAKVGGNYVAAQAIAIEAHDNGLIEGIALDTAGYVSEASGANVFIVHGGRLLTPSIDNAILRGVTRECVITIAEDLGFDVLEAKIPREMLYMADEIFITGTAAEICPVKSVDRIVVGSGRRGEVTAVIQRTFFDIVRGLRDDSWRWLTVI